MDELEMLEELAGMVCGGEIVYDDCPHTDPADPPEWLYEENKVCPVCFITNLYENCSEIYKYFEEETTQAQRDHIIRLYERYCE